MQAAAEAESVESSVSERPMRGRGGGGDSLSRLKSPTEKILAAVNKALHELEQDSEGGGSHGLSALTPKLRSSEPQSPPRDSTRQNR